MGGFKREANNIAVEQVLSHISKCCREMKEACHSTSEYLYNHEDKISNRLVEGHLNDNPLNLRFILQKPEHFDDETDTYKGRTDIQVVSFDWFLDSNAYYIIECKRIDGSAPLNRAYITDGVSRFVAGPDPKYSSYYGRNIMLGYIVQTINIAENTRKIDCIQREILAGIAIGNMAVVCVDGDFSHYKCAYQQSDAPEIELAHLFFDFSDVIK
jgi:hypothetical protein